MAEKYSDATAEALEAALADLDALAAGALDRSAFVVWKGGEVQPDGSRSLPYPDYTSRLSDVWAALSMAGYDRTARLDYVGWQGQRASPIDDPEVTAAMEEDDLRHLIVRFGRGERFLDGYWETILTSGALRAAVRRARDLVCGKPADDVDRAP